MEWESWHRRAYRGRLLLLLFAALVCVAGAWQFVSQPEFAPWLEALQDRSLPEANREAVMMALYDLFDPEENPAGEATVRR